MYVGQDVSNGYCVCTQKCTVDAMSLIKYSTGTNYELGKQFIPDVTKQKVSIYRMELDKRISGNLLLIKLLPDNSRGILIRIEIFNNISTKQVLACGNQSNPCYPYAVFLF